MKPYLIAVLGVALAGCSKSEHMHTETAATATPKADPAAPPARTPVWVVTEGMDAPESAYIDAGSASIYVSIIGGQPDQKDGNGRIAKLTSDGKLVSSSWVTGLNAPKGLRSHQGTLWTADIDEVVSIDIATAKITSKLKVPNAKFLNDVAIGPDGTVYVSDMLASVIYAIKDGKIATFAQGEEIEYPNGLLVEGDRLIVGGWGKPEADFSTKVPGRLFALDLKTAKKTLITPNPIANIDGLESDGHGGWYVSEYTSGKILKVSTAGEVTQMAKFPAGTADFAFTHAGHIMILPHMSENKVAAYDLSK